MNLDVGALLPQFIQENFRGGPRHCKVNLDGNLPLGILVLDNTRIVQDIFQGFFPVAETPFDSPMTMFPIVSHTGIMVWKILGGGGCSETPILLVIWILPFLGIRNDLPSGKGLRRRIPLRILPAKILIERGFIGCGAELVEHPNQIGCRASEFDGAVGPVWHGCSPIIGKGCR